MTAANPALQKLGYRPEDRVVIVHADDVGMCQATLSAFAELVAFGLVSSGSVMVPCPWFPATVAWHLQHPSVDLGIHLTLTSEWEAYRWGPISTRDPASGLLDPDGYFHRSREALRQQAHPEAVEVEMKAQVERARQAGLKPTHLDCHMYAAMDARFINSYVQLGLTERLPLLLLRQRNPAWGQDARWDQWVSEWEQLGLPIFDHLCLMNWTGSTLDRVEWAKQIFAELPPGLSCLLIHAAQETPELRAIMPAWRYPVAEYQAFISAALRDYVRSRGIHIITYRTLGSVMQSR